MNKVKFYLWLEVKAVVSVTMAIAQELDAFYTQYLNIIYVGLSMV